MEKGKIKWYNEVKGFGFIEMENGKDIFIHQTGLVNRNTNLQPGQEVEFEIKQGDKGLMAVNLTAIN